MHNFVKAVSGAGRIAVIPEIIRAFSKLINDAAGLLEAEVEAVVPLPADELRQVAATLGQVFHKEIIIKPKVNSGLLGGILVKVGNYRIDLSLKTKLDNLAQSAAYASL